VSYLGKQQYDTTLGRAFLALIAGAAVAAALTIIGLIGPAWLNRASAPDSPWKPLSSLLIYVGFVYCYAFVVFAAGLALVGLPAWLVLHNMGRRSWLDAAILGLALTFAATFPLQVLLGVGFSSPSDTSISSGSSAATVFGSLTLHGWLSIFLNSILISPAGAIAGLTIWRIAYRRRPDALSSPPP
jgi:hypothetical protein